MTFIKKAILSIILFLSVMNTSFADTEQMTATLARIRTILNQINPLINLAQSEQDPNVRIKFQFDQLRADIAKIQTGIDEEIKPISVQPRMVDPIAGDYTAAPTVHESRKNIGGDQ